MIAEMTTWWPWVRRCRSRHRHQRWDANRAIRLRCLRERGHAAYAPDHDWLGYSWRD